MDDSLPLNFQLRGTEFRLNDATPFYSQLYPERMVVAPTERKKGDCPVGEAKFFRLEMIKYRSVDDALQRDFDVLLRLSHDADLSLHYIHTHRYFSSVQDFWWNFLDLLDQVRRNGGLG
jgi:hypothetical protein